jgi:hypothetical protein
VVEQLSPFRGVPLFELIKVVLDLEKVVALRAPVNDFIECVPS